MNFQVIGTHNPQDFFNGEEPFDLTERKKVSDVNLVDAIKENIQNGYVVIVYGADIK
jgi:hypothetical protein